MATVGRHSTTGVIEIIHPDVTIGNFVKVGSGTRFWGTVNYPSISHRKLVSNISFANHLGIKGYPDIDSKGPIVIGNDVWIGESCEILSGVTIGDGAIIGIRTVVSKSIPPYAVAVGAPVVIKRFRFDDETIARLLRIQWWNWTDAEIIDRWEDFLDVDEFVKKYDQN